MTNETVRTCVIDGCEEQGFTRELNQVKGAPSLSLCPEHSWDLFWFYKERGRKLATAIHEANPDMNHTPGWTYVIRLANGNVKIGTTTNPTMKRLKDITSRHNQGVPVQVLAIMRGGESLEAVIHNQWAHLRADGHMEEFHAEPSLLQWAEQQDIDPGVSDLEDWLIGKQRRNAQGEYATAMLNEIGDGEFPFRDATPREAEFLLTKMKEN